MGSTIATVQKLIAASYELAEKAKSDPALAENLLRDPTDAIARAAGVTFPLGITFTAARGANGGIQFTKHAPAEHEEQSDTLMRYGVLMTVAGGLLADAKRDPKLADELLKDPRGVIAKAARVPIPEQLAINAARGPRGDVDLTIAIDPNFKGELDDVLLEGVSGGSGVAPMGLYLSVLDGHINVVSGGGSQSYAPGQFSFVGTEPPIVLPNFLMP
jgi:hypothetical protein